MAKFDIMAGPSVSSLDNRLYALYVTRQEDKHVKEFADLNQATLVEKLGIMRFPKEDKLRILHGQPGTCRFKNIELSDDVASALGFPVS